jgi:hypothetical protein
MSFSIHAAGRIADAIEQVEAIEYAGDNPQFDAVRVFVLSCLNNWPTKDGSPKGVLVEASGHADAYTQNLTLSIRPLYLKDPKPQAGV